MSPDACPRYQLSPPQPLNADQVARDERLHRLGVRFSSAYLQRSYGLHDGDLDTIAMAAVAQRPDRLAAMREQQFAETQPQPPEPDLAIEAAIDAGVRAWLQEQLPAISDELVQPVLDAVQQHADPETLMDALSAVFPRWQTPQLQTALEHLMFALDVIGRLQVQAELEQT